MADDVGQVTKKFEFSQLNLTNTYTKREAGVLKNL